MAAAGPHQGSGDCFQGLNAAPTAAPRPMTREFQALHSAAREALLDPIGRGSGKHPCRIRTASKDRFWHGGRRNAERFENECPAAWTRLRRTHGTRRRARRGTSRPATFRQSLHGRSELGVQLARFCRVKQRGARGVAGRETRASKRFSEVALFVQFASEVPFQARSRCLSPDSEISPLSGTDFHLPDPPGTLPSPLGSPPRGAASSAPGTHRLVSSQRLRTLVPAPRRYSWRPA